MSKNKHHNVGEQAEPEVKVNTEAIASEKETKPVDLVAAKLEKDDEVQVVTLNLQPYLLPIAIIINAVIIAAAILIVGRGGLTIGGNNTGTTNNAAATVAPTQAADPNGQPATTNIKDSPYLGNKDAVKVAVVEFSDYECPFCKRHHDQVYPDILKNYIQTGKIIYVFKNFVAVPSHKPAATTEAYAALCVRELSGNSNSKYFDMHNLLYTNTLANGQGLGTTDVYKLASQLGVDSGALKTCIDSGKYADTMTRDEADGGAAGVQGTPGFVVGVLSADGTVTGKLIAGAYPFSEFQSKIDEMLAK